jgi:hypothetical protein
LNYNKTCTIKRYTVAVHVHSSRFHLQYVSDLFCNLAVYVIRGSFSHIQNYSIFLNYECSISQFFAASQTSSELFLCGKNKYLLYLCLVLFVMKLVLQVQHKIFYNVSKLHLYDQFMLLSTKTQKILRVGRIINNQEPKVFLHHLIKPTKINSGSAGPLENRT